MRILQNIKVNVIVKLQNLGNTENGSIRFLDLENFEIGPEIIHLAALGIMPRKKNRMKMAAILRSNMSDIRKNEADLSDSSILKTLR